MDFAVLPPSAGTAGGSDWPKLYLGKRPTWTLRFKGRFQNFFHKARPAAVDSLMPKGSADGRGRSSQQAKNNYKLEKRK